MKKKIIFTVIILLSFIKVSALSYAGCDFSDVSRMKQIVSNINVSYNYRIVNDEAYFDVIVSNLTNEIYVTDNYYKNNFYSSNGELVIPNVKSNSIYLKFNSNRQECKGLLLGNRYEQFPIFNKYYDDEVCLNVPISYCNRWVNKEYTLEEIKDAIDKYNNSIVDQPEKPTEVIYKKNILDKIIEFYTKYYYFVLAGIIILCTAIILINKKKNQFKI